MTHLFKETLFKLNALDFYTFHPILRKYARVFSLDALH